MEDIIILILFTYPGIMADFIHSSMVRNRIFDRKPDEFFRAARDFFLSAAITAATMGPFCAARGIPYSLQATKLEASKGMGLMIFIILSLSASAAAALIWASGERVLLRIRNRRREIRGKDAMSEEKKVWASIRKDPDIPYYKCVMAIYKDGQLIRAGLTHNVSTDLQEDPGILMKYTDLAEQQVKLDPEERTLIDYPVVSYVEAASGIRIDIFDGTKMDRYVNDWLRSQQEDPASVSEAAAEA